MSAFTIDPGPLADAFHMALRRLDDLSFTDALWTRRLDVWPGDAGTHAAIAHRLGWLDAAAFIRPELDRLDRFAASIRGSGFTDVVLLGMGGSSLAPEVLRRSLGTAPGAPRFRMLDSTDPTEVSDALAAADTTLFIVASKSGTTIEPMAMAAEARRRLEASGIEPWGSRFVAITDAGTPLDARARADGFRDVFLNPADIGGRFSALSFFGLVPAAAMGLDLHALLAPAEAMAARCRAADPAANPGLALGALMAAGARTGRDKLTLLLPRPLEALGLWIEQLVAESTGKAGAGVVPVIAEANDAPIGEDRVAVAVHTDDSQPLPLEGRLRHHGTPMATLEAEAATIGAEFFRWEVATAAAGMLLEVNPFDEPNVGQAKEATRALLERFERERSLPVPAPATIDDGIGFALSRAASEQVPGGNPHRFLDLAGPGDYLALLAYVPSSSAAWGTLLDRFRAAVARATRCASTLGYGPRYLHSTGQLHKGGADNGVFILLAPEVTGDADLAVPGAAFSFGVLERAQALGDFQSLDSAGRRALLVTANHRDPGRLEHRLGALLDPSVR